MVFLKGVNPAPDAPPAQALNNMTLQDAIKQVLDTGKADIYYDSSFDTLEDHETSDAVKRHQEALRQLEEVAK